MYERVYMGGITWQSPMPETATLIAPTADAKPDNTMKIWERDRSLVAAPEISKP